MQPSAFGHSNGRPNHFTFFFRCQIKTRSSDEIGGVILLSGVGNNCSCSRAFLIANERLPRSDAILHRYGSFECQGKRASALGSKDPLFKTTSGVAASTKRRHQRRVSRKRCITFAPNQSGFVSITTLPNCLRGSLRHARRDADRPRQSRIDVVAALLASRNIFGLTN